MTKRTTAADTRLAERLAALRAAVEAGGATPEVLRPALADGHYRLAAAAAGYAGEGLVYGVERDLIDAFRRLAAAPHSQDPHCTAKGAIARALLALDCAKVDFWLAGIRLTLDPEPCAAFVGGFLDSADAELRESAALALGESRLPEALAELRRCWDQSPYKGSAALVLLKGAVLHRSEPAFDWLIGLVADGERRIAERLVRDLAVYRGNTRLRQRLAEALAGRGDPELLALLARTWPAGEST